MATYLCGLVYLKNKHKKQKRSVSNAALFNAGRRNLILSFSSSPLFFSSHDQLVMNTPENKLIALPEGVEFSYEPIANSGGLGLPLEIRVSLARRPSSRNKYPAYRKELNNWRKKLRLLPAGAMFTQLEFVLVLNFHLRCIHLGQVAILLVVRVIHRLRGIHSLEWHETALIAGL